MRGTHRAILWLALVSGCSASHRGGDGGTDGACSEGAHRCEAAVWSACKDGAWVTSATCAAEEACLDDVGCRPCVPGQGACDGDHIVLCGDDGRPTKMQTDDCSPETCVMTAGEAMCAGPCDPKALAKSYTGCEYYAVDLPQWGQPTPLSNVIASDQQFAIAVANPWPVAVDVTVLRDDAAVGMPASPNIVLQRQVPAGGLVAIPLPQREVSGFVTGKKRNRSMITPNAYRVVTSRPASVYQFNPQNNPGTYSNDASLLIPITALDESYVVLGWPGFGGDTFGIATDKRSFITIVGTRAGTKVRVTPSTEVMAGDNVPALHKGVAHTFTLGEFEALNLEGADFATAGATDFSGTRVEADAPIAVWSGVECITINPPNRPQDAGSCCCDHLEEQLFPRSSLGHDYVVVHSEGRAHTSDDPEFFRILALEDTTDVRTTLPAPDDHFTLQAGALREIVVVGDDFIVTADKAVTVGQFQVSQDSSVGGTGDPSFELVPPVAQFRAQYIFLVPSGYTESWALVALPSGSSLMLDGQAAAGCDRATAGSTNGIMYDALRCPIGEGPHTLSSTMPFGLVVEGWGPGPVSYGYTGGMEFHPVNHDCSTDDNCPTAEFCSGGACVPIIM